jgi:hypothetical protein
VVVVLVVAGVVGLRLLARTDPHEPTRWRVMQGQESAAVYSPPTIAVYSVPNIKPPHALPTLRDLGDQAQVRAIDLMQAADRQSHPWDDLRKALTDSEEPGEKDPFLFERVLVATVSRGAIWLPGDRMVRTQVEVIPSNCEFAAYTIAATDNETVKVSSVEATDTRKLPSDVGLKFPGLGEVQIGGLPGRESSVKTTSEVSSQFEQLGVDIKPNDLRINRESGVGGDVVGNTRIALSVTTDGVQIMKGATVPGSGAPRDQIVLAVTGLNLEGEAPSMDVVPLVPLPHCALRAAVHVFYEQRHILSGREFYDEAKHEVTFVHSKDDQQDVSVVGADDVSPFVWSIQIVAPHKEPDDDWGEGKMSALRARTSESGAFRLIVFSDYGRAVKLAHWVRTHPKEPLLSTPTGARPGDSAAYAFNYGASQFHGGGGDHGLAVIKKTGDACRMKRFAPAPDPTDETN